MKDRSENCSARARRAARSQSWWSARRSASHSPRDVGRVEVQPRNPVLDRLEEPAGRDRHHRCTETHGFQGRQAEVLLGGGDQGGGVGIQPPQLLVGHRWQEERPGRGALREPGRVRTVADHHHRDSREARRRRRAPGPPACRAAAATRSAGSPAPGRPPPAEGPPPRGRAAGRSPRRPGPSCVGCVRARPLNPPPRRRRTRLPVDPSAAAAGTRARVPSGTSRAGSPGTRHAGRASAGCCARTRS